MTLIAIAPNLLTPLQRTAERRGLTVDTLVEDLVTEYLREQRHAALVAEMERYRSLHTQLVGTYLGQYIALFEGRVLDHDLDGGRLYTRLRHQYGDLPILIVLVTEIPEQQFTPGCGVANGPAKPYLVSTSRPSPSWPARPVWPLSPTGRQTKP